MKTPSAIPQTELEAFVTQSRRLAKGTRRNYLRGVQAWVDFAGTKVSHWTPKTARAFYDHMLETTSSNAARQAVVAVRYVLSRVAKDYPGFESPMGSIELERVPESEAQRALDADEARALLKVCEGSDLIARRDWAMVLIALSTGLRRAGLCDINLDRVRHDARSATTYLKVILKGGNAYEVPIAARIWSHVYGHYVSHLEQDVRGGPLFRRIGRVAVETNRRRVGDGLTEDGLYHALLRRAEAAKLADFHPHILRHTMITWCRQGLPERGIESIPFEKIDIVTGHKGGGGMAKRIYTDQFSVAPPIADVVAKIVLGNLEL